jgi:hypothetical protein
MKRLPDAADFMFVAGELIRNSPSLFLESNQGTAASSPCLLTQLLNDTGNAERFVALHLGRPPLGPR